MNERRRQVSDQVVDTGRFSAKAHLEIPAPGKPPKLQPELIRQVTLANLHADAVLANCRIERAIELPAA